MERRIAIRWNRGEDRLEALEPDPHQVEAAAAQLAEWYNESYNRSMMDNTGLLSAEEVVENLGAMMDEGGRVFLLYLDGRLAGDADLRRIEDDHCEFAIMVGTRSQQGKGLGTAFSKMIHAFAFRALGLATAFLTIVPANEPGRRCYEKVGYSVDTSPLARTHADSDSDIAMSVDRATFERLHKADLDAMVIEPVEPGAPTGRGGGSGTAQ